MEFAVNLRVMLFRHTSIFLVMVAAVFLLPTEAQSNGSSVADHLKAGQAALATARAHEADREFRAALAMDPANADALAGLGVADWMRGDCGAAREDLKSALHRAPAGKPANLKTEGLLGICEKRLGDPAAEEQLSKALSQLAHAKNSDPSLRVEVGVELSDLYYQRDDLDRALPVVRELVERNPENIDLLFFAQHLYQEMADETMNKLALIAPGSARMQQVIAEHMVNAGDLKGAAEHYRQALAIDPALPGAHFELGETVIETAPQDAAAQTGGLRELETALRVDGESARLECELGRVSQLQGRTDVALAHYERAYALNPKEVEAQMGIGRILLDQDKPQDALRYLSQAVEQDPLNAEARYRYARALKAVNRNDEAQQQMKLFETVRQAKNKVQELYRQMNKRAESKADEPLTTEGIQP
jgi:tetratricopeptide (TPR) repeat protein